MSVVNMLKIEEPNLKVNSPIDQIITMATIYKNIKDDYNPKDVMQCIAIADAMALQVEALKSEALGFREAILKELELPVRA